MKRFCPEDDLEMIQSFKGYDDDSFFHETAYIYLESSQEIGPSEQVESGTI